MKPAPFRYHAPRVVAECLDLLGDYGSEAKVLAGGQSLMPMMNFRLARPAALIDHLAGEGVFAGTIAPGVMRLVTHADIDDDGVERAAKALATAP